MAFRENTYDYTHLVDLVLSNDRNISDDHPIYIDGGTGESLSYGELKLLIRRATSGLLDIGMKKGDSLCLYAPNNVSQHRLFL